jgi:hypothetical protein
MLDDQGNAAVLHRFPGIVMRVKPGADNSEKETCIRPVPAGRSNLPDIRIHITAGFFHVRKLRKQFP